MECVGFCAEDGFESRLAAEFIEGHLRDGKIIPEVKTLGYRITRVSPF